MRVELVTNFLTERDISMIASISHDAATTPSAGKLLSMGHYSPFEFARVLFRVECPIFVARQLMRHRMANYMERSLRYAESEGDYYMPESLENQAEIVDPIIDDIREGYDRLIARGVPKEDARCILPMGTNTTFYVEYDLRNFIGLCKARISPHAQTETQEIVREMLWHLEYVYPTVHAHILTLLEKGDKL